MQKRAIFLSGPIGAGKTTLGRSLAGCLSGGFIDGDDFSDPSRPWYCSSLRTSQAIVRESAAILKREHSVVVAYPLRCVNWIYFRRRCAELGVQPLFVSLRASYSAIVDSRRGRNFSEGERERIKVMIVEGYDKRAFSDLVIATDESDFDSTLRHLEATVRRRAAF